jgi:predicted metalloendopeptidase
VNDYFGMAVGAMFVSKYFDEKSRSDVSIPI